MKKLSLYLIMMLCIAITPFALQSCDDDDDLSLGKFTVRMATVRVLGGYNYYLEVDTGEKLWVANSQMRLYKPVDGQRVIANYTQLSYTYDETYAYAISVNQLSNVLTKPVEELTKENEEEFGNDKSEITDIWVSGNYLNVEFAYRLPNHYKHRVSLVVNTTVENPEDGYIHLEYRYNDQDDVSNLKRLGFVSFYLGDYSPNAASGKYKGIKIKVNDITEGEDILTYEFKNVENNKEINNSDDVDPTEGKVD